MLVIALAGDKVPKHLRTGYPKYQTSPTHLALPYYGADLTATRAGFSEEFLERVRHCTYRQFGWDMLPIGGSTVESVLRFDHLQPISTSFSSFEATEYKLSDEALEVVEDWLEWHFTATLPEDDDSLLNILRDELNPDS